MPYLSTSRKLEVPGGSKEDFAYAEECIQELQAIRRKYAAAIIAAGIFNSSGELWTEVIGTIAARRAEPFSATLDELFQACERSFPGSTQLINPTTKKKDAAVDLLCELYTPYMDAGFLVGLAVGMQLGPNALDGGVR